MAHRAEVFDFRYRIEKTIEWKYPPRLKCCSVKIHTYRIAYPSIMCNNQCYGSATIVLCAIAVVVSIFRYLQSCSIAADGTRIQLMAQNKHRTKVCSDEAPSRARTDDDVNWLRFHWHPRRIPRSWNINILFSSYANRLQMDELWTVFRRGKVCWFWFISLGSHTNIRRRKDVKSVDVCRVQDILCH